MAQLKASAEARRIVAEQSSRHRYSVAEQLVSLRLMMFAERGLYKPSKSERFSVASEGVVAVMSITLKYHGKHYMSLVFERGGVFHRGDVLLGVDIEFSWRGGLKRFSFGPQCAPACDGFCLMALFAPEDLPIRQPVTVICVITRPNPALEDAHGMAYLQIERDTDK